MNVMPPVWWLQLNLASANPPEEKTTMNGKYKILILLSSVALVFFIVAVNTTHIINPSPTPLSLDFTDPYVATGIVLIVIIVMVTVLIGVVAKKEPTSRKMKRYLGK